MTIYDASASVDVTLEELIVDQSIPVTYERFVQCASCAGRCVQLDWQGQVACKKCQGQGGHYTKAKVRVSLSPGVIDINGGSVRVEGSGHDIGLSKNGDLIVSYRVKHHPRFRPDGKDLVCDVAISPLQAMFGGSIKLPSLTGSSRRTVSDPQGEGFILKGEGGYQVNDHQRGDIRYRFTTAATDNLTEKRAISRIRDLKQQVSEKEEKLETLKKEHQTTLDEGNAQFHEELNKVREDVETAARESAEKTISKLAQGLITSLDSLEKAIESMSSPQDNSHREGLRMILDMQRQSLAQHGVQIIPALGKTFDPHVHEAVAMDPSSDLPRNTVSEVLQTGYRHNGKLLRPAMVRVSG